MFIYIYEKNYVSLYIDTEFVYKAVFLCVK